MLFYAADDFKYGFKGACRRGNRRTHRQRTRAARQSGGYAKAYFGLPPRDVFRIPAQVVSGIGFLGAGMIILKNNNMITGLTTAAGVWTTATIGVALGYG